MGPLNKTTASRRLFNIFGPFLGLLLVIGLFSLSPTVRPYFLTGANFKVILTQTVIVAIGTLGMTLIIVSGGIDLSVGSVVALTSVVGATMLAEGHSPLMAGWLTIAVGGGDGAGHAADGFWAVCICHRRQRSRCAVERHSRSAAERDDLYCGWSFLWHRRFDAAFAADAGGPDGGDRLGAGHHRGGGHRWRQLEWRDGQHSRLDDRRADHGGAAQWLQSNGLADLHAGDHHRRRDHHRGRNG